MIFVGKGEATPNTALSGTTTPQRPTFAVVEKVTVRFGENTRFARPSRAKPTRVKNNSQDIRRIYYEC
jgi:hypothetical protein